jgi:hypothetical protein
VPKNLWIIEEMSHIVYWDAVWVAVLPDVVMFAAPAPGQSEERVPLLHM